VEKVLQNIDKIPTPEDTAALAAIPVGFITVPCSGVSCAGN
jgi:hypothetical protein